MGPRARAYLRTKKASDKVKEAMKKPAKGTRFCTVKDCSRQSSFGPVGGKLSRCKKHKGSYINVVSKRCEDPGCKFQAHFGIMGGKKTHCSIHKPSEMVDVAHPKCIEPGDCPRIPSFDREGGRALYCAAHKKEGMLDVHNRKCDEEGCPRIPSFGLEKGKRTHCAIHKPPGAEDVVHQRCAREGCPIIQPSFGPPGSKIGTHCAIHQLPGHVSVQMRPCSSCGLFYFINKGLLCRNCDPEVQRNKNLREEKIKTFLSVRFAGLEYRHDKGIPDRFCKEVKSRPDFLFDCGTHLVELEVDQFEHRNHEEGCELARQYNIVATTGLPVHFIRYNPDSFSIDGKKMRVGEKRRHALLKKGAEERPGSASRGRRDGPHRPPLLQSRGSLREARGRLRGGRYRDHSEAFRRAHAGGSHQDSLILIVISLFYSLFRLKWHGTIRLTYGQAMGSDTDWSTVQRWYLRTSNGLD
jgi:hypothetical protein